MKKVSQKRLIELLKNKGNYTYKELASLTGYHPKSLIRINSNFKKNNYTLKNNDKSYIQNEIITNYLKSRYKSYKDFYDNELEYNISYSTLCKMLNKAKRNEEIVIIRKIKNKGKYYFEIIDYKTESILFYFDSLKNDKNSFKRIFFFILNNFGTPNNISFVNFFINIPKEILTLLNKYNVSIIPFKSIYRNVFNNLHTNNKIISYKATYIDKEDFYNSKKRKTIKENIIQFKNVRYIIKSNNKIKKNEEIILFYNDQMNDLFIKFEDKIYKLKICKNLNSKKGNSKYN
ncbi:MAG: hypothetical protein NC483_01055 [Ruminococcus sp.]|nr:hypothetical protein [Ruminococcus sp.]